MRDALNEARAPVLGKLHGDFSVASTEEHVGGTSGARCAFASAACRGLQTLWFDRGWLIAVVIVQ